MKDFQDFGASWACPSIQKWHPKKWLDNICNFNGYVSEAKKKNHNSYSFWAFKYLKILQPVWSRDFLYITWENIFPRHTVSAEP